MNSSSETPVSTEDSPMGLIETLKSQIDNFINNPELILSILTKVVVAFQLTKHGIQQFHRMD